MRDTLIGWITRLLSALFPTVRRPEPAEGPLAPASILILKPCCLGDVLLATPAVAALKRAFPDAQIDFAVGSWARAAVANSPHLRQLVDTGKVGQGAYGWRDLWSLAARLRAGHYDLCVTLDRSPRIGLVPWLAGIPLRAGLDSRGRGFAHNIRVPVPPIRYEPELYLDVPRAVIPQTARSKFDFVPSEFFPTDADKAFAQALLQAALPDPRWPIVAIHPGGGNNPGMVLASKRWPAERFAAIANRLSETYKATVVLIGADSDREATQAVRAAMPFDRLTATPLDLTARLNFGQLGALYQRCALMIGNDSGVLHLANAVGTPVVALYGPSDPRVYGPYDSKSLALWHPVGCNPCFLNGRARPGCCPNHAIEAISVEEAWAAVQIVLRRQGFTN